MKPVVLITMGDPVGVGPEITLRALASRSVRQCSRPRVVGDRALLDHLAETLGLPQARGEEVISTQALDLSKIKPARAGAAGSRAVVGYIEKAVEMALAGEADAVVTAPINKKALNRWAGFRHPGHTEFIAELTGAIDFVMMLGGPRLKVALVTIHEPIAAVPALLTRKKILKTITVTHGALKRYFDIKDPRIAVAGLNPHAGEGGIFGREEESAILPAIKKARQMGIDASGPVPPDTVFYRAVKRGEFDVVVCMYHDQGLGPLKLLHFDDGVNVTLGLPIIRTSVDHGTAYDIAWKGIASATSMIAAITTAASMARRSGKTRK